MPRKRARTPPERKSDAEDDDFFFDDSQSNSGRSSNEPVHRNAANARERARMRVLSKAFCRLKTTLPWVPADTKLSKLDTLRLAASYIAHLRTLLREPGAAAREHPLNLAWPFAFQHGGSINCPISPRWNPNTLSREVPTQNHTSQSQPDHRPFSAEQYSKNFDQEYESRCHEDRNMLTDNCPSTMQFCNYGYKDTYCEIRPTYGSGSLMNTTN
ncbi:unnamed protein product [Plutella xylostella]|uniref:(diamondback moth) hypothetical protein n=1 Tax=Plutella xylostella TaxID=51655 RepID=A0A8S4D0F5_PLUXY|nr:unnamed protein product [Plutella xylostella]